MAISEDIPYDYVEVVPQDALQPFLVEDLSPPDMPDVEPQISLHALTGISAPQTLKFIGYIKHRKVIVLIDSGRSPYNFIPRRVAQETHCYIHAVNKFKIMIANGHSIKCGGRS
jgi:hypothetical protein